MSFGRLDSTCECIVKWPGRALNEPLAGEPLNKTYNKTFDKIKDK
jgi:hypothetical protein